MRWEAKGGQQTQKHTHIEDTRIRVSIRAIASDDNGEEKRAVSL